MEQNKPERKFCKFDDTECLFAQMNEQKLTPLTCIACSLREIATRMIKKGENHGNKDSRFSNG